MRAKVLGTLVIGAEEFVVVPRAEYLRVARSGSASIDRPLALGRKLRAARHRAGLTQAALAKKLRCSQSAISQAEAGIIRVSRGYVERLLSACGLPKDWRGPA